MENTKHNYNFNHNNVGDSKLGIRRSKHYHSGITRNYRRNYRLRLGFMSYDFNDHPTSHLVEAIFDKVVKYRQRNNRQHFQRTTSYIGSHNDSTSNKPLYDTYYQQSMYNQVELIIYSFGRHDNSTYRSRLEQLADQFIDISTIPHSEVVELLHHSYLDILLDMQVHTLGNRLSILAGRPAETQVNYLVYPGTSGASFLEYIVGDSVVIPPEHATFYSESLLLLPPTYQISYFDRHIINLNDRRVPSSFHNKSDDTSNPTLNKNSSLHSSRIVGVDSLKADWRYQLLYPNVTELRRYVKMPDLFCISPFFHNTTFFVFLSLLSW